MFKSMMVNFPFKKKGKLRRITLGICAMDKKAKSKPMREILQRLPDELFEIVYFGDDMILNKPIETWPVVEVLIAFYSTRFPTEKALQYVKLRKPYLINDLEVEDTLKDRRKVYALLQKEGIYVPNHHIVNRTGEGDPGFVDTNELEEFDDYIMINGVQLNKPFVEKPVDAEDHSVYIYYPISTGGGSKRLFRKIKDRSSEFYASINEVRREGSFIYEEFIYTQGTDVKVYTVGSDYGHAEARKSPVVDGRVKRDQEGLEERYPVILSSVEKDIARKIVNAFKQTVCGFDILRVQGKSYCCDVNGFSFVKNSRKYYEDASQILTELMLNKMRPEYQTRLSTSAPLLRPILTRDGSGNVGGNVGISGNSSSHSITREFLTNMVKGKDRKDRKEEKERKRNASVERDVETLEGAGEELRAPSPTLSLISTDSTMMTRETGSRNSEELRAIIAVIRHGDRTPKQKIKIKITEQKYLDYYHHYAKTPQKDVKVKSKSGLVRFLEVTREILDTGIDDQELKRKLVQVKDVLERWEISGINRKLQMKPLKWGGPEVVVEVKDKDRKQKEDKKDKKEKDTKDGELDKVASVEWLGNQSGNTSPSKNTGTMQQATEVLLILKWGGDLTPLGREQAENLGSNFRVEMYPDTQGGGVLRLHSTYRHDLKVRASDEGRVMKTAAAFTKGLLELEGHLQPILNSLVTVEEKNRQLLDRGGNMEDILQEDMDRCKEHLNLLQRDQAMTPALVEEIAPNCCRAIKESMLSLNNPLQTLRRIHELIGQLVQQLEVLMEQAEIEVDSRSWTEEENDVMGGKVTEMAGIRGTSSASTGSIEEDKDKSSSSQPSRINGNEDKEQDEKHENKEKEKKVPANVMCSCSESDIEKPPSSPSHVQRHLYNNETFSLIHDRWSKLFKDFYCAKDGNSRFDLTKVPDVYDMIRYDALHNSYLDLAGMRELYTLSAAFENSVVPQEYGTDSSDKLYIGSKMCGALLEKIKGDIEMSRATSTANDDMHFQLDHSHAEDLRINSLGRRVRTRLYFTSESHLQTLLNVLRYPPDGEATILCREGIETLESIKELSYLTQIVFRMFEDRCDPMLFRVEISLSSGATNDVFSAKNVNIAPYVILSKSLNCDLLVDHLTMAIDLSKISKDDLNLSTLSYDNDSVRDSTLSCDEAAKLTERGLSHSSQGNIMAGMSYNTPSKKANLIRKARANGSMSQTSEESQVMPLNLPTAADDSIHGPIPVKAMAPMDLSEK